MAACITTVKYPIIIDCTGQALEIEDLDYVPYTGADKDVNLGEFGLKTGNLEFNTSPTGVPTTEGSASWDATEGTLELTLKGGDTKLEIGQKQVLRIKNSTGVTFLRSQYKAVKASGAASQRIGVALAQANSYTNAKDLLGLVVENISSGDEGFVVNFGIVEGVNTTGSLQSETWADGDVLYLSSSTAGALTKTKPYNSVIVGYVVYAHATQGKIFVNITKLDVPLTTTQTFTSTGLLTSFSFNHGLGATPSYVGIEALTQDARDYSHITYDSTAVTIQYLVAPPVGTSNLIFNVTVI